MWEKKTLEELVSHSIQSTMSEMTWRVVAITGMPLKEVEEAINRFSKERLNEIFEDVMVNLKGENWKNE